MAPSSRFTLADTHSSCCSCLEPGSWDSGFLSGVSGPGGAEKLTCQGWLNTKVPLVLVCGYFGHLPLVECVTQHSLGTRVGVRGWRQPVSPPRGNRSARTACGIGVAQGDSCGWEEQSRAEQSIEGPCRTEIGGKGRKDPLGHWGSFPFSSSLSF